MTQLAWHDCDAFGFQKPYQVRLVTIDHRHLWIHHQEIHPHPGGAQRMRKKWPNRLLDWRAPNHVPAAQHLRNGIRTDAFGVEQNKARAQETDCAVNMRTLVEAAQR